MKKTISILMCCLLVGSTMTLSSCSNTDKNSANVKDKLESIKFYNEKNQAVDLTLYFDASQNDKDSAVGEEERLISKEQLVGELIVNELIKGPSLNSKLKPILSNNTRLLSFSIKDGIAFVNLSEEARVQMTVAKEAAVLKSLASSLTQLPSIKKIKIQIANSDISTLGGNYNLSKPFGKDEIDNLRKK